MYCTYFPLHSSTHTHPSVVDWDISTSAVNSGFVADLQIRLVGMVNGKTERNTDVSFTLDDGTGRLDFIRWWHHFHQSLAQVPIVSPTSFFLKKNVFFHVIALLDSRNYLNLPTSVLNTSIPQAIISIETCKICWYCTVQVILAICLLIIKLCFSHSRGMQTIVMWTRLIQRNGFRCVRFL